MSDKKVWLVTGASKGLGLALVKKLLDSGYRVAATSRNEAKLADEVGNDSGDFLPLAMEVTDESSVKEAVQKIVEKFGQIDVVVNNAGYGLLGNVEELSEAEIRACFDVNVFGVINVCRAVLPIFRRQRSGHILNIASVSGSVGAVATGIYSATKGAVIQLSESLAQEVASMGIKVTAICPGGFRTDFLDKSSMQTPKQPIADYALVREVLERYGELNQNQGGDPEKAAGVMIALAKADSPPQRIYLGSDGLRMAKRKFNSVEREISEWRDVGVSTDFSN